MSTKKILLFFIFAATAGIFIVGGRSTLAASCDFTVTSAADSGAGTLRQAMLSSESGPGGYTICFNIGGGGYKTIAPTSALPTITKPVTIDGLTQPGAGSTPLIEIAGLNTSGQPGLYITAGNTTIRGLAINRFSGDGIIMTHGGNNVVENCYVGTNSAGTIDYGNGASGIGMQSSNNTIRDNLVSGNQGAGIAITGTGSSISADNNTVVSNRVGTDYTGTSAIPNGSDGILMTDSGGNHIGGTTGVTPGGDCTGDCNLFSGNGANGIGIQGVETLAASPTATGNVIVGNYVGVNVHGNAALPNADIGYEAQDAPANTAGGSNPAERNIFSGNLGAGVSLTGTYSYGNVIAGNYIGVDRSGNVALGNHKMGVNMGSPFGGSNNAHDNSIGGLTGVNPGGSCTGQCNVISGNYWSGVYISGNTGGNNQIIGNFIGPGVSGGNRIGNLQDGIGIVDSSNNRIGGPAASARNLISGNGYNGVVVTGVSSGTRLEGNYVGLGTDKNCMPNAQTGIALAGSSHDTAILANSIDCNGVNGQLGIDIGPNGVTANDYKDVDGGPNNAQNYPVIYGVYNSGGLTISGGLGSYPNTKFRIDVYASPVCNAPSPYGEGRNFLTNFDVVTDSNGNINFSHVLAYAPAGAALSLTATKYLGATPYETSEFSRCYETPRQHPDGTVIKDPTSSRLYMLTDGLRQPIGSTQVLESYNISPTEFKAATALDMGLPETTGVYFREGTLVKGSGPNVYIIDVVSPGNYQKRLINSLAAFNALGYSSSDIIYVPDSGLQISDGAPITASQHPDGALVKSANSAAVYLIDAGVRRLIGTPAIFITQRYTDRMVRPATSQDMSLGLSSGVVLREGAVVRGGGAGIYAIDYTGTGIQKRPFASMSAFSSLGYSAADVLTIPDNQLPSTDGNAIN